MPTIDELKTTVSRLRNELYAAEKDLLAALLQASPVKIGDTIISKRDRQEYRVCAIEFFLGKPWLKGNPKRKDGTFGTAIRYIGDNFEMPVAAPEVSDASHG